MKCPKCGGFMKDEKDQNTSLWYQVCLDCGYSKESDYQPEEKELE